MLRKLRLRQNSDFLINKNMYVERSFEKIRGETAYLIHNYFGGIRNVFFNTRNAAKKLFYVREVKLKGRYYNLLEVVIIRVLFSFSSLPFCNLKLEGIIYLVHALHTPVVTPLLLSIEEDCYNSILASSFF